LATALLAACAAFLAAAEAAPAAVERASESERAVAYWTEERMRNARPAEELLAETEAEEAPEPGEPGKPVEVPSPELRPYSAHGRVFFTHSSRDYYCSGTVVQAATRKLVATAGHCVYYKRSFARKWIFVPAYAEDGRDNPAPFGRWRARRLAVPHAWWRSARDRNAANDDLRFDVGMVSLAPRNGRPIQGVVGARRVRFNSKSARTLEAVGYPAMAPFDGKTMLSCSSPWMGRDRRLPPPRPLRVACGMTAGASGGAILNGNGALISLISYSYCLDPADKGCDRSEEGNFFGPQFGKAIRRLYRAEATPRRKRAARLAARWVRRR
jgi:V8-like Glu-specific endopeptidase